MKTIVEKSFDYFRNNQEQLFAAYPDKFLVISGETVLMAADSLDQAVQYTLDNHMEPGNFIIQECSHGDGAFTQTFHSRVFFA